MLDAAGTDGVADKAVCCGRQWVDGNQQYNVDTPDDVGDGKLPLSQPFYGYEEDEPGAHRQEVLEHGETGDAENPHQ